MKVGDTVVINPGISDRTCEYCLDGEQSLCVRFGILGEHLPGTIAEYVVVPAANVRPIPASIPADVAAAFTLTTLTAWRMVTTRARVQAGDEVLIWGIGGGVAIAALQICKYLGAHVWVTSSNDIKLERARALGADETINHATTDVAKLIRDRTKKRGVDVVVDDVGVGDLEAVATRTRPARATRHLRRDQRPDRRNGCSAPVLESMVNPRIDHGKRRRIRRHRRSIPLR